MTRRAGGSSDGRGGGEMTVPHGDLETLLRRELTAAVSRVEPEADALERIRARTRRRPPQPWLLSVVSGAVSRARYWVWRGHWAWSASSTARPQARHGTVRGTAGRQVGNGHELGDGHQLAAAGAALAAIAFLAIVTLAVPPLRQAIGHVTSKVLTGGQTSGGGGTEGNGSPTGSGGGSLTNGAGNTAGANHERSRNRIPRSSAASTCHAGHGRSDGRGASHAGRQIAAAVSSALPVTTADCTACLRDAHRDGQPAGNQSGVPDVAGSDADHGRRPTARRGRLPIHRPARQRVPPARMGLHRPPPTPVATGSITTRGAAAPTRRA